MKTIECLSQERLIPILERHRNPHAAQGIPHFRLDSLLITILEKANEFVPSDSGSVLLDDPLMKMGESSALEELIFVCSFGPMAKDFVGERISVKKGIVGAVYRTGVSCITNEAHRTSEFAHEFDQRFGYVTSSVLCVPIRIGRSICGVIELVNRQGEKSYSEAEKELLEIFAQSISSTIQNALDAKRIEEMVRTDDLTGLSNDRHLLERLPSEVESTLRRGRPMSLIFLDLDRFKEINDTYGHLAGSATLVEFGRLLKSVVRVVRATLVRYGGDEFVVLLPGTDAEEALLVAEAIRRATESHAFLSASWGQGERPLELRGVVTASLGVTTLGSVPDALRSGESPMQMGMRLLQTADRAMYASKSRGKNAVTAWPFRQFEAL